MRKKWIRFRIPAATAILRTAPIRQAILLRTRPTTAHSRRRTHLLTVTLIKAIATAM